jgi:class 3 adenylate cyclase/DNA-binding CsgD family transcriptional regulator
MLDLPAGTVTFLFTDLVGSTRLVDQHGQAAVAAINHANVCLGGIFGAHRGFVFKTVGDNIHAAFPRASDAVLAAVLGQRALANEDWGQLGEIQVRMGLHTGDADPVAADYDGEPLYRCSHLTDLAHGGQVLLSAATTELVRQALPERTGLRPLGSYRLRSLSHPERVSQVLHPDLRADFPPLRSLGGLPDEGPLTPREREVIALVARGYSNRQIAESLVLAVSTVERHVANILAKLSLSSRSQVSAWAGDQDILDAPEALLRPRLVLLGKPKSSRIRND